MLFRSALRGDPCPEISNFREQLVKSKDAKSPPERLCILGGAREYAFLISFKVTLPWFSALAAHGEALGSL